MIFFSGARAVPPVGWGGGEVPTLTFLYSLEAKFPTASTCDITLRIPTSHKEYTVFREHMILALKSNDGFGMV